jgi:DNA modification methylase
MTPATWRVETGSALDVLADIEAETVQTCVTSPPYWGLRDYGDTGQEWPEVAYSPMPGLPPMTIPAQTAALGLEADPWAYVGHLVEVFRAVRRVLRADGTLWLNLGDCFQDKQLQGIPWRVAFALQADGWYLRSDIVWAKPNPMPESITDRPTKAHEYLYLLSKRPRYYYDHEAIKEPDTGRASGNIERHVHNGERGRSDHLGASIPWKPDGTGRNSRSVWTITTRPFPGAHFATFPPELPERCIKAGTRLGDMVLDPFSGAGTTGMVARRLRRAYIGIEQSEEYADMSRRRIDADAPLFNRPAGGDR